MQEKEIIKEVIKRVVKEKVNNSKSLEKIKKEVAFLYFKKSLLSNIDLLEFYHKMTTNQKKKLFNDLGIKFTKEKDLKVKKILVTKPIRSLSGIVNVSVLTKPYSCPGKCIYCPEEKGAPKSYLKGEPAVMRAITNKYSPKKQVKSRIESLKKNGHPVDKIELRIIGATWSYYQKKYQNWFIKECFRACNPAKVGLRSLKEEQKINEKAKHRIVGLSIETRPDFINENETLNLRNLGVTSVELGVQSVYEDVLKKINRGHGVLEIIKATKMLKDAGIKVSYQMMPNLPGSSFKKDIKMFKILFSNPDFKPDYLKIYPLSVLKNTKMYALWKNKKYKPYNDNQLKKLLKEIKKTIPYYVRIQRLIRDIPAQEIEAGTKSSNLRQTIQDEMKKENLSCKCIRCREIKSNYNPKEKLKLFRSDYCGSEGKDIFLSYEDKKRKNLYSLLRARIPSENNALFEKIPILKDSLIIREIHTYGQQLEIKKRGVSPQHKGLGKKLIKKTEKIAEKEFKIKKTVIISAVGTRNYYRKQGYRLKDTYMIKYLSS